MSRPYEAQSCNKATRPTEVSLKDAKWAFTTRRVERDVVRLLLPDIDHATAGDLVLCEVLAVGQHKRVQITSGRPSELYVGDRIVLVCGARYAPDQFEADAALDAEGSDMVAGGGIVGCARASHDRMGAPTRVRPLGRLGREDGTALSVSQFALPERSTGADRPNVIAVVGSSMNAGKTTVAASLARGLAHAGLKTGGAKITGTGAFGDYNAFLDAGISDIVDFTDAGVPSTYRQPLSRIETIAETLVAEIGSRGCEVAVVELADGVFQEETAALMRSARFAELCDGVVFAAADALGAATGVERVRAAGLPLLAVSGLLSRSPLAMAEAERETNVPCLTRDKLLDPATALGLLRACLKDDGVELDACSLSATPGRTVTTDHAVRTAA